MEPFQQADKMPEKNVLHEHLAADMAIIHSIIGYMVKDIAYSPAVTWNKFSSMSREECCLNAFLMRAEQSNNL